MKVLKLIFIANFFFLVVKSQSIEATYQVSQDIFATLDGEKKKVATIESTGHLYRKDGRYIYFENPNYLDKFPGGMVKINVAADQVHFVGLCEDSVQKINFKNMDSLMRYYRPHISGKGQSKVNYKQYFDADYFQWEMIPETKQIQGLKCQRAMLSINNSLQWIVWFTSAIPMQAGLMNIIGIPGLIVEAESVPMNTRYSLVSYTLDKEIPEKVFHPKEFEQPFELRPKPVKRTTTPEKSKIQKQAELTNQ